MTIQVTKSVLKKDSKPTVPLHKTSQEMNQPSYLSLTFDSSQSDKDICQRIFKMNFSGILLDSPLIGVCQPNVYGDIQSHNNMSSILHILPAVIYKHHRKGQMGYCLKGMKSLQCENQSHHICYRAWCKVDCCA